MDKDFFLYFFALIPSEDIQSSVTKIKLDFQNRYNASHALKSPPHITLIPPFKFERKNENRLIEILNEFSEYESKFQQSLKGFGMFPPKVIFIKVPKNDSLKSLYSRFIKHMDEKLNLSSYSRRAKNFFPHMTVAFRDLTPENFYKAKPVYEQKHISIEFEVNNICLLRHNSIQWEIIHYGHFKP